MNERIKELAEKTEIIHEWMTVGERNDKLKMFEKIAQLIVRECIDIAYGEGDDVGYLKWYFGVQE